MQHFILIMQLKKNPEFPGWYPIPSKRDLLNRLYNAKIFSKFDMKSGFCQIQITEKDRYKTTFTVPFGHYEWNVMPFGLKNVPPEFRNIMNDIFTPYISFIIVTLMMY